MIENDMLDDMLDDIFTITLGDLPMSWHGATCAYDYQASHSLSDQQRAYHASVAMTGLFFDYTNENDPNGICNTYKKNAITGYQIEILRRYGRIDCTEFGDHGWLGFVPTREQFVNFFFWFIGLSLPNFKHTTIKPNYQYGMVAQWCFEQYGIPFNPLNGWKSDFCVSIGNGLWGNTSIKEPQFHDFSHRYTSNKFMNITANSAVYAGRLICDTEYEVRVDQTTDRLLYHEYAPLATCKSPFLQNFVESASGRIIRAGCRYFFEKEDDALLFRLSHP